MFAGPGLNKKNAKPEPLGLRAKIFLLPKALGFRARFCSIRKAFHSKVTMLLLSKALEFKEEIEIKHSVKKKP